MNWVWEFWLKFSLSACVTGVTGVILTNHEERHCEVFSSRGLHSSQNCPHHSTANAHKCNHHDEPADADCLWDGDATAGLDIRSVVREADLWLLLDLSVVSSSVTARSENKNNFNTRKLCAVAWTRSDTGYADNWWIRPTHWHYEHSQANQLLHIYCPPATEEEEGEILSGKDEGEIWGLMIKIIQGLLEGGK